MPPIFTYQCQKCAHMEEAIVKYVDRDTCPIPFCKNCGNTEPMLRPSEYEKANFHFKDGGHRGEYTKTGPRNNHPKRK